MKKEFPTTVAQDTVLKALGLTAENYPAAESVLYDCGLKVTPVRQGRTSVPSIRLLDSVSGGVTAYGEGDYGTINFKDIDLTPILQWIDAKDQKEAQRRIATVQTAQAAPAEVATIEETETQELSEIASVQVSTWQGADGWYWTVISPDGINYDDDHGPYTERDDALASAENAIRISTDIENTAALEW